MRPRALELVVCPSCRGSLEVEASTRREGDELLEGNLSCTGCGRDVPVRAGVPRFAGAAAGVPESAAEPSVDAGAPPEAAGPGHDTASRFGMAWTHFDRLHEHYEQQFLGWIAPNQPEDFEGLTVLEGGCGKGRHSALVAKWGAKDVVAVDLGFAVDVAFRNCRHLPNVHVVQADLLDLPVSERSVDLAFSVGVLHHTEAPRAAFEELAHRVRPGGKVVAWVYGRENNGWIVHGVNPVRKVLTSRLPFRAVSEISRVPAAVLWLLSRGVYKPLSRGAFKGIGDRLFYQPYMNQLAEFPLWELHSIVADHLVPPIAHYIPHDEFVSWFDYAGLVDVTVGWHNQNSWRGTGVVPPEV